MNKNYLQLTAAHARPGLPLNFYIRIDGKKVYTGGFVTKAVKVGDDMIAITIQHYKTGEEFTNTLHADKWVWLCKPVMAKSNPHLFGDLVSRAKTTMSIVNGRAWFFEAEVGSELSQESSMPPGETPQTIVF